MSYRSCHVRLSRLHGLVCSLYGGDVTQAKKSLQCLTPSPCPTYRLQSLVRSYLKVGTWGYRSFRTGSRALGDPPWTLGQFQSCFSICLTQQRTERSSGKSAKLHWEKAKKLLPAPSVKQKSINQKFFRSSVNFPVLFNFSVLWTGTRLDKGCSDSTSELTGSQLSRGRLEIPTPYKHAHFTVQISNIYCPFKLLHSLNQAALR